LLCVSQGIRQELARHLHRQVAEISHQLDILICGKQQHSLTGESCLPLLFSFTICQLG